MATTHFENVDLLKSLMGGGRTQALAPRRPAPTAATPPPPPAAAPSASDNRPSHDVLGITPMPSPASSRPTVAGGPGPKREAAPPPPPYQAHAPPARADAPRREARQSPPSAPSAGAAASVRTFSTPSSPALSLASLPGYETQPPAPPPSPPGAQASSSSNNSSSSGLKALFQTPVPLGFREGKTSPPPAPRRQSAPPPGRGGGGPEEPPALSPMTSVASFRSLTTKGGGGGAISELEGDSCLPLSRLASYGGAGPRRLSSPLPQAGAARRGGRSQLFVYKPRLPTALMMADAIAESPAGALVFELDGSGVGGDRGIPTRSRPAEGPEGEEDARKPAGPGGEEKPEQGARPAADASVDSSQAPARRNEADSAAWHRRTKMFQV